MKLVVERFSILIVDESTDGSDVTPGSDPGGEEDDGQRNRRRLLEMARAADDLLGEKDEKLKKAELSLSKVS